jgi:hypothetical protein
VIHPEIIARFLGPVNTFSVAPGRFFASVSSAKGADSRGVRSLGPQRRLYMFFDFDLLLQGKVVTSQVLEY